MSRFVWERKVTILSKEVATQEAETYLLIKVTNLIIVMNLIIVTDLVMVSESAGIIGWRGLKSWGIMIRAK